MKRWMRVGTSMVFTSLIGVSVAFAYGEAAKESGTAAATTAAVSANAADIIGTATAAGSFKTLLTAIAAADLTDVLKGKGPFTVFAPTDAAFAKLPAGTLDSLLKDKEKLTAILKYHVVPGQVTAAQVTKLSAAKTLEGQDLAIASRDGVTVNGAKVVKADVMASNGVIHVIDQVLVPAAKSDQAAE